MNSENKIFDNESFPIDEFSKHKNTLKIAKISIFYDLVLLLVFICFLLFPFKDLVFSLF